MNRRTAPRRWSAIALAGATALAGAAYVGGDRPAFQKPAQATKPLGQGTAAPAPVPPAVELAAAAVEATAEPAFEPIRFGPDDRARLAAEMSKWVTRDARQLVDVIADLAEERPLPLPPTYLMSIAWKETRGKVLAVSPAGAAGLAQATPAAYLSEGFDGKIFMTTDYLAATRAFIMKKPLGDALTIARPLLTRNTPAARERARELTARAIELRREGMDELEALRPFATETFLLRIEQGDEYNLETLQELERLIDRGAPAGETKRFVDRVQRDYTYLRNLQRNGWEKYARDLAGQRDALLKKKFGQNATAVILNRPYEAGEYLGRELDARFSPTQMAAFLAKHLETKQQQARDLGVDEEMLDTWTAALYNGGAVNVKRMKAGLIGTLRETQDYMKAVPARSALLQAVLGA